MNYAATKKPTPWLEDSARVCKMSAPEAQGTICCIPTRTVEMRLKRDHGHSATVTAHVCCARAQAHSVRKASCRRGTTWSNAQKRLRGGGLADAISRKQMKINQEHSRRRLSQRILVGTPPTDTNPAEVRGGSFETSDRIPALSQDRPSTYGLIDQVCQI